MNATEIINIIDKLIWPITILLLYFLNQNSFKSIFKILIRRIEAGAPIEISSFKVGAMPNSLNSPKPNETINENHVALMHTSWRYPKKDKEFGKKMFVIQVIVMGNDEVLDKIEWVKYFLHKSYPNNIRTVFKGVDNFEFKELAWGEFVLKAEIKIKDSDHTLKLSRYINLTETGTGLLD